MNTQPGGPSNASSAPLERAIVLLLLDGGERRWSASELAAELEVDVQLVESSLRALDAEGVVGFAEDRAGAMPAVRRLDELRLIAI